MVRLNSRSILFKNIQGFLGLIHTHIVRNVLLYCIYPSADVGPTVDSSSLQDRRICFNQGYSISHGLIFSLMTYFFFFRQDLINMNFPGNSISKLFHYLLLLNSICCTSGCKEFNGPFCKRNDTILLSCLRTINPVFSNNCLYTFGGNTDG